MEGVEENGHTFFPIHLLAVRAIGSKRGIDSLDVFGGHRLTVKIPSSELHAHVRLRGLSCCRLPPVENRGHFRLLGLVIDEATVYFDPSVSFHGLLRR